MVLIAPWEEQIQQHQLTADSKHALIKLYQAGSLTREAFKANMKLVQCAEVEIIIAKEKLKKLTDARSRGEDPLIWKLSQP